MFDNLSTLSPSLEDENSAVAWNPLNDLIVALKHEGIASLIVHHTGKSGKEGHRSYRGSSNLATTLETILSLEKVDGEKFAGARFKIRVEKARNSGE